MFTSWTNESQDMPKSTMQYCMWSKTAVCLTCSLVIMLHWSCLLPLCHLYWHLPVPSPQDLRDKDMFLVTAIAATKKQGQWSKYRNSMSWWLKLFYLHVRRKTTLNCISVAVEEEKLRLILCLCSHLLTFLVGKSVTSYRGSGLCCFSNLHLYS